MTDFYDVSWMFKPEGKKSPSSLLCPRCRKPVHHFSIPVDESEGVRTVEYVDGVFVCRFCNVVLVEEMCVNAQMQNFDLIDRKEKSEDEVDE